KLRILTVFALFLGAFDTAAADTLDMDGVAPDSSAARPASGTTAAIVESTFGAPDAKVAPVGDPPISRWVYKDFVVFFEYERVIHAVIRRDQKS
ncbi:MAG: hypothetical protein GQ528_00070, partial [Woeseiaceae bacterium]|nr:hypothetical protein [Woeseiaceae bacterium]